MVDEIIWQEHTYEIVKQPDVGFGIAISGGLDNPGVQSGDPSIIISDVVKQGPAFNKLQINDTVVRVNNRPTYGLTHQQAVRELKNSGKRVVIAVKRKALVRVERTPSPGSLRRSRSRNLDSLPYKHRSRSRDRSPHRRHRSRSRDLDSPSRSRRHRSAGRAYSRSRSRSPRRGRSYSRSRSRSSRRSVGRSRTPSSRSSSRSRSPVSARRSRSRSRGRSRSRSPSRHRSRSRGRSLTPSSRSASPVRTPPVKHRSVDNLRSMSPLSPDPPGTKHGDEMMVFPVKPTEPKPVVLKKTRWNNSYGLKLGTRIFIQDIQPGSLADKNPELKAGDTILMINGRNVDNKNVQEAIQIIGLSKDKLTMLVKKEEGGTVSIPASRFDSPSSPEAKHRDKATAKEPRSQHSSPERDSRHSSRSRKSSRSIDKKANESAQVEPKAESKPDKKTIGGVSVFPTGMPMVAKRTRSGSSHSSRSGSPHSHTPEPAPRSEKVAVKADQPLYDMPPSDGEDGHVLPHDARNIRFVKGRNVGIRLAGGNDVGIFVASVQESSPAAQQGLRMGDQILSVNETDFRNVIREEAVLTLMGLPNGEEVQIVAQPRPEVYKKILEHGTGDSFYIRTHFKYERANDHEMSFMRGSIFRISDTLYQGMVGYWLAVRIGRSNMEIERGVIPNGSRAQQLKEVQDKKIQQAREKASQGGGIKRRLGKGISKGKPEKLPTSTSPQFPAYERVVLREAGFKRPVVVFGPLSDIARQRLASDFPTTYEIAGNEGTVTGQKSNRKGIIRLNTIKDIIEKDKHAILDITPTAVEKLNYAQLYPIVVFLKPESKAAVKELRNKLAVTEEEKRKKPGKLYDRAVKMQKGYSHVCTDIIPLTTVSDDWYRKLHSTIKDQQNMPVWVSEDKLGGTPEEDSEGVMVPGDDDRLSYVSAPASDYSVTTVGSEMLRSNADYEDHEDVRTKPGTVVSPSGALMPSSRARKQSSSSSSAEEDAGNKFGDDDLDDALRDDDDDDNPPASKPIPPHGYGDPEEAMPEAPPRGKKQSVGREHGDTSSSSSEERHPVGARPTPIATAAAAEPSRTVGHQSIPEGRFDPQSFLKNHIKRLNKVKSEEAEPPVKTDQGSPRSPRHEDRVPVSMPMTHSAPPPREPSPEPPEDTGRYPQPQSYARPGAATGEPLYAQVNKKRPGPGPSQPPINAQNDRRDHRESSGRDYAGEIDSFISTDPYRGGMPQRRDPRPVNSRPPVREEPQPQPAKTGDSYQQQPQNSYNRFAAAGKTTQPPKNQYQPQPFSNKPSTYRNPMSNGPPPTSERPPKSQFVQDKYKDYMSQIRQADNKPSSYNAYNPRPFNKNAGPPSVASKFKNGPVKDQMYDSGVDTYDNAKPKLSHPGPVPVSPSSVDDDDPQVVATARGVFDSNGGVLSSVETGVSIMIPKGAIPTGVKQEIYFKVCKDNTVLPPLDKEKGETLLSPLVMCGPHGLQFNHPVELRLPHCEPSQWQNMNMPSDSNYQVSSNSVSVLIDHF